MNERKWFGWMSLPVPDTLTLEKPSQSQIPLHLNDPLSPRYPYTQKWIPFFWYHDGPSYKTRHTSSYNNETRGQLIYYLSPPYDGSLHLWWLCVIVYLCISLTHLCVFLSTIISAGCVYYAGHLQGWKEGALIWYLSPPSKPARALIDQHTALRLNATMKYRCR